LVSNRSTRFETDALSVIKASRGQNVRMCQDQHLLVQTLKHEGTGK
tara:strand:+ start:337 stop:474 length:138 start_codon:yes stop_codon:yes gene_type:complete